MLAWVAGAVVPLVLHLLSRSRYRAVPWGAMMFLSGVDAGPRHSASVRQWTLLLLRMGVVGLLAVALARPVIASRFAWVPTAGLTTGGQAAVVIILKDSPSMGYTQAGKSRLDLAREVALQILTALKRGDEAALLVAGAHEYQQPIPPSADLQSIASRIADLQPDTGQCDLAVELNKAADLLQHATVTDRRIYLICDRQELSWRNITDAFKKQWQTRGKNAQLPQVTVIPVGGDQADNIVVEGIEFPDRGVFADQPANMLIHLHNYGPDPVGSLPLSVWTGSRTIADLLVDVPAHGVRAVNVPVRFYEPGSRVVSAAVKTTGLTTDDRMDHAVDVLEPPRILLVTSNASDAATKPADDLNGVLSHSTIGRKASPGSVVTEIGISDLNAQQLKSCTEVVLDDAGPVSAEQTAELRKWMSGGGGVLMLLSDTSSPADYGKSLCQPDGILPAAIHPLLSKSARLGPFDRQHPILRSIGPRPDLLIPRYFPVSVANPSTHILARLTGGEPFILESSIGRGHAVLLTAPVDPHSVPAMLQPMIQSMVRYLGTGAAVDRNLWPGQPILAVTRDAVEDRSAFVQFLSGGAHEPAVINRGTDQTEIHFNRTNRPGTYRLRYKSAGREVVLNYVVSAGHADSDLTPLTDTQWAAVASRIGFDRVDLSLTTLADAIDVQRGGREIWIDLLGAILLLMVFETVLSRWWSVG